MFTAIKFKVEGKPEVRNQKQLGALVFPVFELTTIRLPVLLLG